MYDWPFETGIEAEWLVAPVVEKVFGIDEYAWSAVLHLHVAASFVVALNVACVVPDENT